MRQVTIDIQLDRVFQWLLIFSIPIILLSYLPQQDMRVTKFYFMQFYIMLLLCLAFCLPKERESNNLFVHTFFVLSFINFLTHPIDVYGSYRLTQIFFAAVGFHLIYKYTKRETVALLKRAVVITALINCALFLLHEIKYYVVFDFVHRPAGFMLFPAHFSLLVGVSVFLLEKKWQWLEAILIPCLILSHEASTVAIFFLCYLTRYLNRKQFISIILLGGGAFFSWALIKGHIANFLVHKLTYRMDCWDTVIKAVWARPIDGFGLGAYARSGMIINNNLWLHDWTTVHNEPLDLFLSMGIIGLVFGFFWLKDMNKNISGNYMLIAIIFMFVSLFHSVFQFADTLWLGVALYALSELERGSNGRESDKSGSVDQLSGNSTAHRLPSGLVPQN